MANYAVIDVGTNSVKLLIAERLPSGAWRTLREQIEVTRLGERLHERGALRAEAMERTASAVAGMAAEAGRHRVAGLAAVGTMGLRTATNAPEFQANVRHRCGVDIQIISGEEEGRLGCLAVRGWLGPLTDSLVVFDTGGGSSQFTFARGERVETQFSVNVGAVRLTESYGLGEAVSAEAIAAVLAFIRTRLAPLERAKPPEALVGLGGAVTNLASVKHRLARYDPEVVQGSILEAGEVDRQIELYRQLGTFERRGIVGLQASRAEVILAGACVVRTVLGMLRKESLRVSDRGLRHGVLADRFGQEELRGAADSASLCPVKLQIQPSVVTPIPPSSDMTTRYVPLLSSSVAGPLGVIHLPRLWLKASLEAAGKLAEGYPGCGQGFDQMVIDGLGLRREAVLGFIRQRKPTYPEFEAWVRQQPGVRLDQASVAALNAAIAGYDHDEETRRSILKASGLSEGPRDAVNLNNLDDWQEFHAAVLK